MKAAEMKKTQMVQLAINQKYYCGLKLHTLLEMYLSDHTLGIVFAFLQHSLRKTVMDQNMICGEQ